MVQITIDDALRLDLISETEQLSSSFANILVGKVMRNL